MNYSGKNQEMCDPCYGYGTETILKIIYIYIQLDRSECHSDNGNESENWNVDLKRTDNAKLSWTTQYPQENEDDIYLRSE